MNLRCQTCGIATTNRCTRCHKVAYCDRVCQRKDWLLNHRDECKDNQLGDALQRVAEIVHEAYLTFRENTWDTPIERIVVHSRGLTIYDGDQRLNTRYFTAFPTNTVGDDIEVKKSVLTAWACEEPYAFLHNLTMALLKGNVFTHCLQTMLTLVKGLNVDVEELSLELQEVPRIISVISPNCSPISNYPDCKHAVLLIRSLRATRKQWAIDLCGAQYGLYQVFSEWLQYDNDFVARLAERSPPGTAKQVLELMAEERGMPALTYGLVGRAAQALDAATTTWEAQNGPVSRMRSLTGAAYDQEKASLLQSLSNTVRSFVATNDFTALVRREKQFDGLL
jgi:hypothetical protein